MTYTAMQDQIADELARSDLTSQIQLAILAAIEFYKDERFNFNELKDTASTVDGTQNYLMPDSSAERPFIRPDFIQLTVGASDIRMLKGPIDHAELVAMTSSTTYTGIPSRWSYYQNSAWLYPIPDGVYTLTAWYVGRLALLSAGADENGWTTEAAELVMCRAKWRLYQHVIRDREMARDMKGAELEALNRLRGRRDMEMAAEIRGWL